jgi:hypothetical protein
MKNKRFVKEGQINTITIDYDVCLLSRIIIILWLL